MRVPPFVLIFVLAAGAVAQTRHVVAPAGFGYDRKAGESGDDFPFIGGQSTRQMQLFDNAQLGFGSARIKEIAWRRDAGTKAYGGFAATLTLRLGHSAQHPDTMSQRFADLPTGAMTTVFRGAVSLPAAAAGPGPHPWSIVVKAAAPFAFVPARGNLLLEVSSQQGFGAAWRRDARKFYDGRPGSFARLVPACPNANGFRMTNQPTVLPNCAPGRRMTLWLAGSPPFDRDVFHFLGTARRPPIDLGRLGAPGCNLAVLPWLLVRNVPTTQATASFSYAYADYLLPGDRSLIGARIASQWFNQDRPKGNTLGIVLSDAIEITLGAPPSRRYATQAISTATPNTGIGVQAAHELGAITRFGL